MSTEDPRRDDEKTGAVAAGDTGRAGEAETVETRAADATAERPATPERAEEIASGENTLPITEPGQPAEKDEVAAGATSPEDLQAIAAKREADEQAQRTANEARAAETREQLAHADTRRAEEAEAAAQKAREDAEKAEQEAERQREEARKREQQTIDDASRARQESEAAAQQAREADERAPEAASVLSGATVTSPGVGLGTDPGAAAAAARDARAQAQPRADDRAVDPDDPFEKLPLADKPELQAAAAFGITFVLAKVLKIIGS